MQNSNSLTKQIPNLITLLNLISGCISITMAVQGNYLVASYLIILSALLDFLDGLTAKALNAVSEFGKAFDSLVDIVSFGIAPSILVYQILVMSLTYNDSTFNLESANFSETLYLLSAFLITIFASIRLARFNVRKGDNDYFMGLPTPASAIFIASVSIILFSSEIATLQEFILNNSRLLILVITISFLMVINLPMLKLSFPTYKIKENLIKYILIVGSAILLIIFRFYAIPFIILLYILLSIINTVIKK